jgi:hypothetical protein
MPPDDLPTIKQRFEKLIEPQHKTTGPISANT